MNIVKVAVAPALPEGATRNVAALGRRLLEIIRLSLAETDWHGLRPSHFRLLGSVTPHGMTITELSKSLSMTKQAVGQFVTQLEEGGHLVVRTDETDRRRRIVLRTSSGDETVAAVDAHLSLLERRWAQQVGAERYANFRAVLTEISQIGEEP